jgi:hypothetical protein
MKYKTQQQHLSEHGTNTAAAYTPIKMLLMGMCTIFTKNPTNPMTIIPMPVEMAIFLNSEKDTRGDMRINATSHEDLPYVYTAASQLSVEQPSDANVGIAIHARFKWIGINALEAHLRTLQR